MKPENLKRNQHAKIRSTPDGADREIYNRDKFQDIYVRINTPNYLFYYNNIYRVDITSK